MRTIKAKLSGLGVGLAVVASLVTGSGAYATSGPTHDTKSSDHRNGHGDNDRDRHDDHGDHKDKDHSHDHDHNCPPIVVIPD